MRLLVLSLILIFLEQLYLDKFNNFFIRLNFLGQRRNIILEHVALTYVQITFSTSLNLVTRAVFKHHNGQLPPITSKNYTKFFLQGVEKMAFFET